MNFKKTLTKRSSTKRTPTRKKHEPVSKYDEVRYAFIREQHKWLRERRATKKLLIELDISIVSEIVVKDDNGHDWHALVVTFADDIPVVLIFRGYRDKVYIEGAFKFVDFTHSGNILYDERRPVFYDC